MKKYKLSIGKIGMPYGFEVGIMYSSKRNLVSDFQRLKIAHYESLELEGLQGEEIVLTYDSVKGCYFVVNELKEGELK